MVRNIVLWGDPVLREKGKRVVEVTDEIRELAEDMLETMRDAQGVGLAAQQVGEAVQLAVIDVSHDRADIEDARLEGNNAEITVRFQSEVSSVIRNADGRIIEGNPSDTEIITDVWTFARDTSSSDPNWLLVETEREDDTA